jgi:hypothetical protein
VGDEIIIRFPGLGRGRQEKEEDGKEMADAAAEDEGMPNGVMILTAVPDVENDTRGVTNAASHEQRDAGVRDCGDEGTDDDEDEPAGHYIGESGDRGWDAAMHEHKYGARSAKCPDDREERPAKRAAQFGQ